MKKNNKFFSFPVLQKNGMVVSADTISDVHIPMNISNWVFVSPEQENILEEEDNSASQNY